MSFEGAEVQAVTIDGPMTRDYDDAVWVDLDADGRWRITVCVADVASAVAVDGDAEREARSRIATRYRPWGNTPMLPRDLAEDLCSLRRGQRRAALIVSMTSTDLRSFSTAITVGHVRVTSRLMFADIPALTADPSAPLHVFAQRAVHVAQTLLAGRRERGALALYDLAQGWMATEEGFLRSARAEEANVGYIVVQELMVLANAEVARWATERDVPVLFRNHEARAACPDRRDLQRQLDDARVLPIASVTALQARTYLLLGRADYGRTTRGHYGLNLPVYAHFTSPIRRYADLVTHRQIRAAVRGEPQPYGAAELDALAAWINERAEALREEDHEAGREAANTRAQLARLRQSFEGLSDADFERVLKLEARGGGDPTPPLVDELSRRASLGKLSLNWSALVLAAAPPTLAWGPCRRIVLGDLRRRPEDAVSTFHIAAQFNERWQGLARRASRSGPDHAPRFHATASARDLSGPARTSSSKRVAEQLATLALAAVLCGEEPPPDEAALDAPTPNARPVAIDPAKDAVSALAEWCATTKREAPVYAFVASGPAHKPVQRCTCRVGGVEGIGEAASKREAKHLAAGAARDALRGGPATRPDTHDPRPE